MNSRKRVFLLLILLVPLYLFSNLLSLLVNPEQNNPTTLEKTTPVTHEQVKEKHTIPINNVETPEQEKEAETGNVCSLPSLNPFHPSVLPYLKNVTLPKCINDKLLEMETASFEDGILTPICPKAIYEAIDFGSDDYHLKILRRGNLTKPIQINTDFVRVTCNNRIKRNFAQVVRDSKAAEKAKEIFTKASEKPLNVIILGFDSTSRASYQRNLPRLQKWFEENLQQVNSDLDEIESEKRNYLFPMDGYMVAGDGTTAQLQAMLTGRSSEFLPEARSGVPNSDHLDKWPFIFKEMEQNGYITAIAEDRYDIGAFTFRLNGFKNKPTTHYMRPFFLNIAENLPCEGHIHEYQEVLNYSVDFLKTYSEEPKFLFAYTKVSHDDTNYIQLVDQDMVDFMQKIKDLNLLESSMIVMFGDHGTRFGDIRLTKQGKLEERMPMNLVMLPRWFLKRHEDVANAIATNQKRLVTPYDFHATFKHILGIAYDEAFAPEMEYQKSLFGEISKYRSCAGANVNDHHCICYKRKDVDVNNETVVEGTLAVLNYLNGIVSEDSRGKKVCERLQLGKIIYAEELNSPDPLYQVQFEVTPGPSTFEGTFHVKDGEFEVVPDYSRVTPYVGGKCGVKAQIMRVCYCKEQYRLK